MKWEDYVKSRKTTNIPYGLEKTDIECPKCGKRIYKDTTKILCSYPPQYGFQCIECGWYGTAQ